MKNFASLCLLAYKRPKQLKDCIESIQKHTNSPYELIINIDGGDSWSVGYLTELLIQGKISKLILNGGKNRGVGRSFQQALSVAEGDIIVKLDTDLTFTPDWLLKTKNALESNADIGCIGLFDYNTWDPLDSRFQPSHNLIVQRENCDIVKDFVSCAYAFRAKDKHLIEPAQDDGNHQKFERLGLIHVVNNSSFGVGKSVYVSGTQEAPYPTPTCDTPLVFE